MNSKDIDLKPDLNYKADTDLAKLKSIYRSEVDLINEQKYLHKQRTIDLIESKLKKGFLPCSLTSERVHAKHKRCSANCSYAQKNFRFIDLPYRLDLLPRDE
jgi:hypothetical protein